MLQFDDKKHHCALNAFLVSVVLEIRVKTLITLKKFEFEPDQENT